MGGTLWLWVTVARRSMAMETHNHGSSNLDRRETSMAVAMEILWQWRPMAMGRTPWQWRPVAMERTPWPWISLVNHYI